MKTVKTTRAKQIILFFMLTLFIQPIVAGTSCCNNSVSSDDDHTKLQKFYKSQNGALIYVRQIGKKVVWLAERFDAKFVAVFNGEIKDGKIIGTYYNLPKGKIKGTGSQKIKITNNGKTLKVTGGNLDGQLLKAMPLPSKVPARRKPFFSGSSLNDLTGWWHAKNAGFSHMVDNNGVIAGYFYGHQNGTNARPLTAKVFFGNRKNNKLDIEWVDIPLGNTKCSGKASFKVVGPKFIRLESGYFPGLNHEKK